MLTQYALRIAFFIHSYLCSEIFLCINLRCEHLFAKLLVYTNEGRIGGTFMEDRELIRQILNNDYRAMEELHRRYVDRIFNYIYSQTNDYHDAEELLQDVFFKTATRLHQFEGKSSFKTWIFKIARNVVIDYYRKNKHTRRHSPIEENRIETLGEEASLEHTVLQNMQLDEVMRAIDNLPEHYRMVLHLRFIEDFTLQETADTMGKTVLSVKSIQLRARRALSEQINMEVAVDD